MPAPAASLQVAVVAPVAAFTTRRFGANPVVQGRQTAAAPVAEGL